MDLSEYCNAIASEKSIDTGEEASNYDVRQYLDDLGCGVVFIIDFDCIGSVRIAVSPHHVKRLI